MVLLDTVLHERSGFAVAAELLAQFERRAGMRVIPLSGYDTGASETKHFDAALLKPIDLQQLLRLLTAADS